MLHSLATWNPTTYEQFEKLYGDKGLSKTTFFLSFFKYIFKKYEKVVTKDLQAFRICISKTDAEIGGVVETVWRNFRFESASSC